LEYPLSPGDYIVFVYDLASAVSYRLLAAAAAQNHNERGARVSASFSSGDDRSRAQQRLCQAVPEKRS